MKTTLSTATHFRTFGGIPEPVRAAARSKLAIAGFAVIYPLLMQAADAQAKYKQPDLPKEELALLAYHPFSEVHVLAIDGVEYAASTFFARGYNALNVYVLPGIHVLLVRMANSTTNGMRGCGPGLCIETQPATLQVDVKKGRRYVLTAWYFRNGVPVRFTTAAQQERSETAKSFAPDSPAKFPWLENIHFEISDATDLPEEKWGTLKIPDLRWLTRAEWKWNRKEEKISIPDTLEDLEKQIASRPEDPWIHRQRALVELWTGKTDYGKATAEATKAIALNPSWSRAYQERGWIRQSKGDIDKEIEDLNKAIELAPQFSEALMMRGNAWQGKGDSDRAIADFTRAIETDACNLWSYHRRGEIWMKKGEYDKALADQSRAIAIAPNFAPAHSARAGVWVKKQDYDKAIADYTAAIGIDLKLFPAYLARAEVLLARNELDRAIADYSRALRIDDRSSIAYTMRGLVRQKQGEYDPAIADFTKALEIDPSAYQVHNWRGVCWSKKGESDRAMADFTEALRQAPADPWASEAIASLFAQKGDGVQAADYCMKAGRLRVAQKDLKNAIADWNAALAADPRRAAAFQQRAETYAQLAQVDMAIADYTRALALAPGQTQWAERLEELRRDKGGSLVLNRGK